MHKHSDLRPTPWYLGLPLGVSDTRHAHHHCPAPYHASYSKQEETQDKEPKKPEHTLPSRTPTASASTLPGYRCIVETASAPRNLSLTATGKWSNAWPRRLGNWAKVHYTFNSIHSSTHQMHHKWTAAPLTQAPNCNRLHCLLLWYIW